MMLKFQRSDGSFHSFHNINDYVQSGDVYAKCLQKETLEEYFSKYNVPNGNNGRIDHYSAKADEFPSSSKEIFFGERCEDEKYCMKRVAFISNDTHYCVFTQYPVYACNEDGKTVDKF